MITFTPHVEWTKTETEDKQRTRPEAFAPRTSETRKYGEYKPDQRTRSLHMLCSCPDIHSECACVVHCRRRHDDAARGKRRSSQHLLQTRSTVHCKLCDPIAATPEATFSTRQESSTSVTNLCGRRRSESRTACVTITPRGGVDTRLVAASATNTVAQRYKEEVNGPRNVIFSRRKMLPGT